MSKKKKTSIQFQIDLNSLKTVGKITEGKRDLEIDDINLKISESLKNLFTTGFTDWITNFNLLIKNSKHLDAYKLIQENKWTLRFSKTKNLDNLLKLDRTKLSKEQRKDFLLTIIAIASKEVSFGKIENEIDLFLTEFDSSIDSTLKQSINLSKGNAAAQNGKINVANNFYKKVVDNTNASSVDIAYAYRGLAKIAASKEDIIQYHNLSADKFLEAGKKNETITDLVFISTLYEKDDKEKSLNIIDSAIQLYDSENILDKEFSAGLHHKKAGYLLSLNKIKEALETIEIACELRDNIIGNEYESYSSHSVAKSLCDRLKKKKRALYHSNKIDVLTPNISGEEFDLQIQLQENMDNEKFINKSLLTKIEKSSFQLFKFSAYIFNSLSISFSFEEKLDWLDRAKLLLNEKDFYNNHYTIYFHTTAEVYRNKGEIEEAIKNYELSLEYNPFHYPSIQNCGAVLWQNKMWDKSLSFFQKQIDTLGESSTLCYALGRSYFELKNYQEAFIYFRKVSNDLDGVDISKYISDCLKKDKDLKLNSLGTEVKQSVIPISLESFKGTIEEFSQTISSNSRMYFWKNDSGTYKWESKPEERGKQFLITALEMKYGKKSIDIIQERAAGAGKIDLYLLLRGGLKVVVELKICGGSGYSSSYAISGEDQLVHYLKNTDTKVGFLVVFDGRTRDYGKGFKKVQSIDELTIFTTAVEMTPKIKK